MRGGLQNGNYGKITRKLWKLRKLRTRRKVPGDAAALKNPLGAKVKIKGGLKVVEAN